MRAKLYAASAAAALTAVAVAGGIAVAAGDGSTADCTAAPAVVDTAAGSQITVTCTVPKPPPVTETVTVTPQPTQTPTPTPSPSQPPTSSTPTPTPTPTPPTPTPTPSSPSPPAPGGFPDASTTGVPAGVTLTPYTGPMTINGTTTIDAKTISGQLVVNAGATLTLTRSKLSSTAYYGILSYGTVVVEDSDLVGGLTATVASYEQGKFTGRRIDVSGGEDGVRLSNNSVLEDSYVHDLANISGTDPHYDTVTADGYRGWRIEHNTIVNKYSQTACVWVGDPRYGPSEGIVTRNYLAGGGYCIYGGPGTGAGIRVTDNVFSTRFYPRVGYWGVDAYWQAAGNTWTGNTYADGPNAGKPVNP